MLCTKFMSPKKQRQLSSSMPRMPLTHLIVRQLYIQWLCPSLLKVITNTYRENSQLFISGSTLYSHEGTTQGDPLAMAMYAIAVTPLIHQLECEGIKQAWYADDATADG